MKPVVIMEQSDQDRSNIKQEKNNMATIKKALKPNELDKVSGGNIFEDIYCYFEGHGYNSVGVAIPDSGAYQIVKYKCTCCGKIIYQKEYPDGNGEPSSQSEFDSI